MSIQQQIESKLSGGLRPLYLMVENESHQHNVPTNSETHFKVTAASNLFVDMRPVARHQRVYQLLAEELAGPVHALALHLYTEQEWSERQHSPESPKCLGGSKA